MSMNEKKSLKLRFPCDPKRFNDVISLCNTGGMTKQELSTMRGKTRKQIVSTLEKKGYYKVMTKYYIRISTRWNLLHDTGKVLVTTDLGEIFLHSWNKKQEKTAKEILYYSFVNSEKFPAMRYLVLELERQLRQKGIFEISNTDIHNIIQKEYDFKFDDSRSLSRALFVLGLLEKQKNQYLVRPYSPSYEGFFLTMFHNYLVKFTQGGKRISRKTLDTSDFLHCWLMNEKILNQYINQGYNARILHLEKHADVNQLYFLSKTLTELVMNLGG